MFPNLALPDLPFTFPLGGIDIAFYAVAIVILVTAVFTVVAKNILQSAVFLIFSFVATAILYMLLHAEFIALAQVMTYVGGVVILVVFTILLTTHLGEDAFATKIPRIFAAFALSIGFVFVMVKCILPTPELAIGTVNAPANYSSLQNFAVRLLGYDQNGFIIPFEAVSVLLLMTLICAITVARRSKDEVEKEKEVK
ncbi:MAG: NADH-quinone oxidoreductase subunit J [Fibrobacter sp.]|nr:NADH-quinone oxidoreductase subunit J [Fibrobacter sp.]